MFLLAMIQTFTIKILVNGFHKQYISKVSPSYNYYISANQFERVLNQICISANQFEPF